MFLSLTISRLVIALIVVSFVFSPEVSGAEITKRVVFPKGKKSVSYKGKLPREYASYDSYVLRAKKGQTITVKLTTTDRDASFAIYETKELGPDEDTILPNNEMLRLFTGKLPITSEYSVQVYGVSSIDDRDTSGADYTIEISLR
ncbi:MAG: hypothetical protein ACR2MG_14390 [Pyrinomonadaceae bacterium]